MNTEEKSSLAYETLGPMGRMLSGSKSAYANAHPKHTVYFNGNVYDSSATKLWYGDVDLTKDGTKLKQLARQLGESLYVTREMPFRFDGATPVSLANACLGEFPAATRIDP